MGLKTLLEDYGITEVAIRLCCDATAGKGIAERRGVGRVRHLHTPLLWLQSAVQRKLLQLHKVSGEENPADLGTKHVEGPKMWRFLRAMGHFAVQGRSDLALKAAL